MSVIRKLFVSLLALGFAAGVAAQDVYVPDDLDGWQRWVLEGHEYRGCPLYFNRGGQNPGDYVCAWPSTLTIDVDADGGRFSQSWRVVADNAWLPLPGNAAYWPDRVQANGAAIRVVERNGRPSVFVGPGSYRLTGGFAWDEMPGVLPVAPEVGLIDLTVAGEAIARPQVDRSGVFLGKRRAEETEARDAVSVDVYRLVDDRVPMRFVTRLRIDVSGSVREETFGPVLPDTFVPVALESALPARLEADGRLRVQVRPGRWELTLEARAPGVLNTVPLPEQDSNLPDTEIWSYQARERLRVTAAEGLPPVDPQQADVPGEWAGLPAFRITKGEALAIVERSRGIVGAENQLSLARTMWLDFDGSGYVVRDEIGGTMRTDWRLDMQPPFALKSASENGENLLVTEGEEAGETGVELRQTNVDLRAIAENESRGAMPVTGWDSRFASVATTLYLPPGHQLLAAPGADAAAGSWAGQWALLDFFLVLIISIAAYRLFGPAAGAIALAAVTLSYHELNAPVWLWLNLLVAIALLRVAPAGRLRTTVQGYLGISGLLLVLALVPFVASQLRIAIYPQLEPQWGLAQIGPGALEFAASPPADAPAREAESLELMQRKERQASAVIADRAEEIAVAGSRPSPTKYARYAPNAIVQAGPGIPSWQWNANRLTWSGPVEADQSLRLVILPRWLVTAARVVEVLLLLLFTAVLAAEIFRQRWRLPGGLELGRAASAGLVLGIAGTLFATAVPVHAQTPDPELLRELERRLLEPPECAPRCAEISAADIDVGDESIRMTLAIDALEAVAVPLPGSQSGWRPDAIVVEAGAAEVVRDASELLWLRVPPGQHRIRVSGAIGGADSVEIPFPAPPRVVDVSADGWFVAGVKDRRLVSGSLQLTRLQADGDVAEDGTASWQGNRFPPFVAVERTLELGLDWQITTRVRRIAPQQGALTLEVPLLDGESVVSGDFQVTDGRILVSMNPTQQAVVWQSNLERRSPIELVSAAGSPWVEVWRIGVGPIWHAQFSGVPESETSGGVSGARVAEFHPRGGETLVVTAYRPEPAGGSTLAFDAVDVRVDQGARSRTTSLEVRYRSTRGDQHVIRLPDGAEVTRVTIDGRDEPLRPVGNELTVPILPGEHAIGIDWRDDRAADTVTRTPAADLGAPASNLNLGLALPQDRWLLLTSGPRLGPGVLYWSELAVLVLFALILGRIDWTPLATRHWLLLGLGFSTFNWPVLGLVILWLLVVGARDRWRVAANWWQYNLQQAAVVGLTAIALVAIVVSLPLGLLGTPDMSVVGNNSFGNTLNWFADRTAGLLPTASAVSVPLWIYKVLILAWALWLSFALLRWLPWTWQCFARDGFFRSRKDEAGEGGA